jgi:salicylate hydroxylase
LEGELSLSKGFDMADNLTIIVCGAGIAGLCAGIALAKQEHKVIILERASELSPMGAGIHLPPNATLLLKQWGILEKLESRAVAPAGFVFRRYGDSSALARSGSNKSKEAPATP